MSGEGRGGVKGKAGLESGETSGPTTSSETHGHKMTKYIYFFYRMKKQKEVNV